MNELMKSPRGRATILIGIANLLWLVLAWEFLVEISEDKPFLLAWRATAVVAPTVLIAIQAFVLSMRPISVWWLVGASCAGVTTLAAPIYTRDTQDALMVLSIAPLVGLGYWLSIFQRASLWGGPGGRRYPGKLGSFGRLVQAVKEDAMRLRGRRLSDETAAVADALDAALAAKLSFAAVAFSGFRRRKEFFAANGFLRLERDFRLQLGVAAKALNEAHRELGLEGELEIANRYDDADQELKRKAESGYTSSPLGG